MGSSSSSMLSSNEISEISKETSFNRTGQGLLTREDFLNVPELAINPLSERIVDSFFINADDNGTHLNFRQFATMLSHFQPIKGKKQRDELRVKLPGEYSQSFIEDLIMFVITIDKEEFKVVLNNMVGANITNIQLEKIAERTLEEADLDKDGKISFEDFCKAMENTDIEDKMSIQFLN